MRAIDADAFKDYIRGACEEMKHLYKDNGAWAKEITESFCKDIDEQPTIHPEPHWIPVTERLPEEKDAGILKKLGTSKRSEYVLATVEVKGERMTVTACTYDGKWDWNMKYAFPDYKIIAWMPLPEPYKGVKE